MESESLELIKTLQPDIFLSDIRMPKLNGVELVSSVKQFSPTTRIIMLSAYDDEEYITALIRLGVSGYLLKTVDLNELAEAIRTVYLGQTVFDPLITGKIGRALVRGDPARRQIERLKDRELEVLRMLAGGLSNQEIATRLVISIRTVEGYVTRIYEKLAVSSRSEAINYAVSKGLIDRREQNG